MSFKCVFLISELESVENYLIFSKRFSHEAMPRPDEMLWRSRLLTKISDILYTCKDIAARNPLQLFKTVIAVFKLWYTLYLIL